MHSWLCSSSALLNRVAFNWLTFWNRNNSTYNSFKNHQPSNGSCYTSDLFDFMLLDKPQVAFENCCVLLGTTSFHFLVALCAGVIVVVPLGCNSAPWVGWAWDDVPCSHVVQVFWIAVMQSVPVTWLFGMVRKYYNEQPIIPHKQMLFYNHNLLHNHENGTMFRR